MFEECFPNSTKMYREIEHNGEKLKVQLQIQAIIRGLLCCRLTLRAKLATERLLCDRSPSAVLSWRVAVGALTSMIPAVLRFVNPSLQYLQLDAQHISPCN